MRSLLMPRDGAENFNYKGALAKDSSRGEQGEREYQEDKRRGKRPLSEYRPGSDKNGRSHDIREHGYRANVRPTGEVGRRQRGRGPPQGHGIGKNTREELREAKADGKGLEEDKEEGQCSEIIRPVGLESRELAPDEIVAPGTKVRKALFQLDQGKEKLEQQVSVDHQVLDKNTELNAMVVEDSVMEDAKTDMEPTDTMGIEEIHAVGGDVRIGEELSDTSLQEQMVGGALLEVENKGTGQEASDGGVSETLVVAPVRKQMGKGNVVLKGVSSKKRGLIQTLLSPRKHGGNKNAVQFGDGLYPGKPRKDPGYKGDQVPPKPDNK